MTLYNAALYDMTQNLQGQLFQTAQALAPAPTTPSTPSPLLQLRRGLAESPAWLMVQAVEFEPEPLSVERLRVRAIWSSERVIAALLELMASEKWLARIGEEYHLLPEGQRIKAQMSERTNRLLAPLETAVQTTDVHRLETLLARIIENALHSETPPGVWCLQHSRRRAPSDNSHPLRKIFQYCADLNAFRDDSHMAAWRPYDVSGAAWEAFNTVVNDLARNADDVFDQLAYRGYSRQDYAEALQTLVARGWLIEEDSIDRVTDEGRSIYEQVETLTDRYFYAPWFQLSETELKDLHHLLGALDTELKMLETAAEKTA
jgi:hypothetical protein